MHGKETSLEARALEKAMGSSALLEALPIGVYCCDKSGILSQFNKRAAELWGRVPAIGDTTERFCGSHKLFLPDGSPLPHSQTPMAEVLRTGRPVHDLHVVIERPDGTRVTVMVNIEPLFNEDGTLVGAVNCFQDVSEMVRAYDELRKSKDDLDDFFENAAVGLHIVGSDGTILRANQAEMALLGYDRSEYIGRHITEFHADAPVIEDILTRLKAGEHLDRYPARLRAADGSIRHVLITSNARFHEGSFVQTRCFTLDVTETRRAEERARAGELRFQQVLEGMPVAIYTTDAEGFVTFYNRAAAALAGRTPQIGVDRWSIFERIYTTDETPLPVDEYPTAIALRERRTVEDSEFIAELPDGSRIRCTSHPTPLFDVDGRLMGAVNMTLDVSGRHKAELESAHLAAIIASSNDAIVSKTLEGVIKTWNVGAERIFGYTAEEMIGQPIIRIIPPELHEEEAEILSRLQRGERIEHFETERITKDDRRLNISLTVSPIHDRHGRIVGASKVARDVTERRRAEQLQRLLISELNHRVKNTLATVQSIANQTVRVARSPAEFAASFSGRIQALAHTHDLLTRNSWQGADITLLLRDQLLLNGAQDDRISFSGPSLTLDPQPALHLALVLHELGTNARKYGSLSVPQGHLSLSWVVRSGTESSLLLFWEERGGPPVEVPDRRGFGSTLIERSLAAHGGEVSIHYRAEGVTCEIALPIPERARSGSVHFMNMIQATVSPHAVSRPEGQSAIEGKRVLVVEDEPLIAMDIAAILTEVGCIVLGPAATFKKAKTLIDGESFDAVLLDANLDGRPVDELAATLTRMDIPFAFLTGYEREGLPTAFRQSPMVNKPFTRDDAIEIVRELTGDRDTVVRLRRKKN